MSYYANNKGADQLAHPRSLISAFVVRCLDSTISLDSIAEISRLVSVAAQAGLCLAQSETPEDTFCRVVAQLDTLLMYCMVKLQLKFWDTVHKCLRLTVEPP